MSEIMKRYLEINNELRELKTEKESIKAELMAEMKLKSLDLMEDEFGNKATIKTNKRKVLDREKLEEVCISKEIDYDEFFVENEYEIFKIIGGGQDD